MSYLVIGKGASAAAVATGWRIPADETTTVASAVELLDACRDIRTSAEAERDRQLESAREAGFAAGRDEGRASAQSELAESLASMARERQRTADVLAAQVAELTYATVCRIIGALDPIERVRRVAGEAVRELRDEDPISLRLSPAMAAALAGTFDPHGVRLIGDSSLAEEDCVIDTADGSVWANASVQLAALRRALGLEAEGAGS